MSKANKNLLDILQMIVFLLAASAAELFSVSFSNTGVEFFLGMMVIFAVSFLFGAAARRLYLRNL